MVIAFVVMTFAAFILLDLLIRSRQTARLSRVVDILRKALDEADPRWVAGFRLPVSLHYHQGHTWVYLESPDRAYVGVDDFARRLLGKTSRIQSPSVGTYLQQGQGSLRVRRDGEAVELPSPVSGEVVAVNPNLKKSPDLVHKDSYGQGWIYKIRSRRLVNELANLLHGSLAARWMEDTRDRFQHHMMLATGSVIQDGGAPVEDLSESLTREEWRGLVKKFLLSKPD
jgi:glycine cleavage system H lipoate-binding protein